MQYDGEDLALGEEITELVRPRGAGGTAVMSIRLSRVEFAQVEALSDAAGVTLSDLVRDALRAYVQQRSVVSLTALPQSRNFYAPATPMQVSQVREGASAAMQDQPMEPPTSNRTERELLPA